MIFMSQSGLTDPFREDEWARWYVEHLRVMRTVDGIDSAERFISDAPGWPPSLAMYTIRSAAVFDDPYYQKIRGMGSWLPLIDRRYSRRNLFAGAERAPTVPAGSVLLVTDGDTPTNESAGVSWTWLKSVGLDCSTPYRGIAVATQEAARALPACGNFAVYRQSANARNPDHDR